MAKCPGGWRRAVRRGERARTDYAVPVTAPAADQSPCRRVEQRRKRESAIHVPSAGACPHATGPIPDHPSPIDEACHKRPSTAGPPGDGTRRHCPASACPARARMSRTSDSGGQIQMSSWLPFVVLTVLSWGTYIPTLHKGQAGLGGSGVHAFLMVGVAYVLVAIAIPGVMIARAGSWHVFTPERRGVHHRGRRTRRAGRAGHRPGARERRPAQRGAAARVRRRARGRHVRGDALQPAEAKARRRCSSWGS